VFEIVEAAPAPPGGGRSLILPAPDGVMLHGKLGFKPVVGWTGLAGDRGGGAAFAGVALGHQLWALGPSLSPSLLTRLDVNAPFGGARGHRLEAKSVLGAWLGPACLSVGPTLRWDHQEWSGGAELPTALLVGASVGALAEVGPLRPSLAVEPAGLVAGARRAAAAEDNPLPVLLDETTWRAALFWVVPQISGGVTVNLRETAIGPATEVVLSLGQKRF
jgi:hypothetical protein